MTDGERLVWAATFATSYARHRDADASTKLAAAAIFALRDVARYTDAREEAREFIDEMVHAP